MSLAPRAAPAGGAEGGATPDGARAGGVAVVPGPSTRDRLTLGLASLAVLVAAADTYVVVLALTSIMTDVGVGIDQLQQATPIISGFLLGYVVVLPLLGRLSDLYGRRAVFLTCLGVFAAGSMVTASAQTLGVVVVGRTLQGLGGGGLVPVTLALVADLWPAGRRGLPLGAVGAVQELGSVLGPLYGAGIVALSGWRAIFWLNLPIAAVLAAGFALSGRRPAQPAGTVTAGDAPARLPDLLGGLLLAATAVSATLALVQPGWLADSDTWGQLYLPEIGSSQLTTPLALAAMAGVALSLLWGLAAPRQVRLLLPVRRSGDLLRAVDWGGAGLLGGVLGCVILAFAAADPSSQVLASNAVVTLPAAAVLAVLFVLRERRAREPLIELGAMRDRAAWGSLVVNLAVGAALMAALIDVPIFARATVDTTSQVNAAFELVRLLVAVPVGALLGGLLCDRLGSRVVAATGLLLAAAMFLLMARWGDGVMAERGVLLGWQTPLGGADVDLLLCGLGFGLAIAPVNAAVLAAVQPALHGVASALVVVARMVGMLVGLSLLTALGLRRFYDATAAIPSPDRLCPASPLQCPAYDSLQTAAVLTELHTIFLGAAVAAALAAGLAAVLLRTSRTATDGATAPRVGLLARLSGVD